MVKRVLAGFEQGLLSRVTLLCADAGRPLRARLPALKDEELNALRQALRACQELTGPLEPGPGWKLFELQFQTCAQQLDAPEASDALKAFLGRAPLLATKLAMLYHASTSREPVIAEPAWRHALTLTQWIVGRTAQALQEEIPESDFHANVRKILRRIPPGGEARARELKQRSHLPPREFAQVMKYPAETEGITQVGGGKTGDPWRYRRPPRGPQG